MTKIIVSSVIAGVLAGYFFIPEAFVNISEHFLVVGLCVLLFFVGVDLGMEGTVISNFKKVGFRIAFFPMAVIIGTFVGVSIASVFLPITLRESLMVGSGFGWYSLAPIMISEYSDQLSAISFMHNVMREVFGLMLIPFVAKYIGYVETTSLPGAAAMDVALPIVERGTNANIAVYSFISGVVLSICVPIFVQFFMG